jgi:flagellar biosynthetic protein FliR
MGFVVRLSVSIAETAAEVVAPMMGLSATHLFDPHAGSGTVLAVLLRHICVLAGLLVGAHRVVLGALLESFRVLPVGAVWGPSAAASPLTRLSADVLAAGVRIAIPVIAILFVAQVALAFISRAAPAMQVFNVGFAVTLAVGLAVLILLAPDMTQRLLAEWSRVGERFELVLAAFGRRP